MSKLISFDDIQRILGNVRIPAMPGVLHELHAEVQRDEPDVGAIADAIGRDVGIAGLVLKTVNSSFYGLRTTVNSIRQATALLGLLNVSNLVAGLALQKAMDEQGAVMPSRYWDSPVNVALLSAMLATRVGEGVLPDEAYLLGLFRNAGEILLATRFDDYAAWLDRGDFDLLDQAGAEDARYSTNHAVVGYFLARNWQLPDRYARIILAHHDVAQFVGSIKENDAGLMCVLKMAEHIDFCYWGRAEASDWPAHADTVLAHVGMSETDFADLVDDSVEMLNQAQQ